MGATLRRFAAVTALATTSSPPLALSFRTASASSSFPRHHLLSPELSIFGVASTAASARTKTSSSTSTAIMSSATTTNTTERAGVKDAVTTPASKLEALRSKMKELGLDYFLIPSDDPHLSEYVPDAYMRRKYLTGFGGSAGTAVVGHDVALLWTDSRYWNEANLQLDNDLWTLMKQGQPKVPTIVKYLGEQAVKVYKEKSEKTTFGDTADANVANAPLKVGIDPYVHPASFAKDFADAIKEAAKTDLEDEELAIGELVALNDNLIDPIWGGERPPVPYNPFRVHPLEYAGVSVIDKVAKIRKQMDEKKATMSVFCTLDDVAYLFNVRCQGDVETCPVGIAYATVCDDAVNLYCDSRKVDSSEVQDHLSSSGVTIKSYDQIVDDIVAHATQEGGKNKVWIDRSRANLALVAGIPEKALVDSQNAITPMKAQKNDAEMEGMRQAHIVDGAAMAKFMAWLEDMVVVQGKSVSEVEIDEVLTGFRAEQPGFVECSFPTIAGVGSNAAIIHYRAKDDDMMKSLDTSQPILIDSGGQYAYGTTDVTRTWHMGEATKEFKEVYTRVLKGNIGVDQMVFPENTPGFVLDVMARQSLWEIEKDYGHGTGHGVGAALNVHEGPFGISPRFTNMEGLKKGIVVSNEPGFYEDGVFGIRIENLLESQYVNPAHNKESEEDEAGSMSTDKKYLCFKRLTQIPIQKNLIDVSLLTKKEVDWLDAYHQEVFDKVSPLLEEGSPALEWLTKSTSPMERL